MPVCENCRASVPKLRETSDGKRVCCPECVFNPLGCRCKYGELGVPETMTAAMLGFDGSDEADADWEADEEEGPLNECGRVEGGGCVLAGSAYCEFECSRGWG